MCFTEFVYSKLWLTAEVLLNQQSSAGEARDARPVRVMANLKRKYYHNYSDNQPDALTVIADERAANNHFRCSH